MKKLYKKILSFTLAIVLLAVLAVTAFAATLAAEPYTMMIHGAEWTVREEGNVTYFKPPEDWFYPGTISGMVNWKPPRNWEMELVNWAPAASGNRTPNRMPAELAVERYIGLLGTVKGSVAVSLAGWVISSGMLDDMIIGLLYDELLEPSKLTDLLSGLLIDLVYDTINDLTGDFFPDEILGVPLVFDPAQILADIIKDLMLGNPQYDGEGNEYYPESILQVILESDIVEQIIWRTVMQIFDDMDKGPLVDMFMDIMLVDLCAGTWNQGNPSTTLLIGNWSGSNWNSFGLNINIFGKIIGAAISGDFSGLIDLNNMSVDFDMDMLTEIIDLDLALEVGLEKAMEVGMEYLYYYLDKGLAYGTTYVYNLAVGYLNDIMERDQLVDPYGRDLKFKLLNFSDYEITIWQWREEGYRTVVYGKDDVGEGLRSLDFVLDAMFKGLIQVADIMIYETIGDSMDEVLAIVQLTSLAGSFIGDLFGFDISMYIDYVSDYLQSLTNCHVYGHAPSNDIHVPATCTNNGAIRDYCLICLTTLRNEVLPATGHSPQTTTQEANCYQYGFTRQTCSTCSLILSQVDIPQRAHDLDTNLLPATCTTPIIIQMACKYTDCAYTQDTPFGSPLGHDWGAWSVTTPATCEVAGLETCVCNNDPSHTDTRPLAAPGHTWGAWSVTTPAICEVAGLETRVCDLDPSHTDTRPIAALVHNWSSWSTTKLATCTEAGEETCVCAHDATHIQTHALDALGHIWGLWTVTVAPQPGVEGEEVRVCARDISHVETRVIPALPLPAHITITVIYQTLDGYELSNIPHTAPVGASYLCTELSFPSCVYDSLAPGSAPAHGIAGSTDLTVTLLYKGYSKLSATHMLWDSGVQTSLSGSPEIINNGAYEYSNEFAWNFNFSGSHTPWYMEFKNSLGEIVQTIAPDRTVKGAPLKPGEEYTFNIWYVPYGETPPPIPAITGTPSPAPPQPPTSGLLSLDPTPAMPVIADFVAYHVLVSGSEELVLYGPEYLEGYSSDFAWNHEAFSHLYTPDGYHYEDIYGNIITDLVNGETYILKVTYL